jgi:type II secretory pathway component PulF
MGLKEVAQFSRNLGRMIRGGVPLGKALAVLEEQADSRAGRETLRALRAAVQEGETFSQALRMHGRTFGPWYVSMVRAGEAGGALSDSLERVGELLYREVDLRGRVRAALAYPGLMVTVGCVTVFVLLSFVIPKISTLFTEAGRTLPLPSLVLIRVSEFFGAFWWAVLLGALALGLLARLFFQSDAGRRWGDGTLLRTPLIGTLLLRSETARLCRVLGTLLRHGVPLLQGLTVTSATLRNRVLQDAIERIILQIRQGDPLSAQLQMTGLFPPIMTHVVAIGEQSGELDQSLLELAEDYESEIDRSVRAIVSMIEPLLIILVGGVVGFIVMALLLPIFEINEVIQ